MFFYTVDKVLKACILGWFAVPSSSRSDFVRTLHYDPLVLGGPTQHGSQLHRIMQAPSPWQGSDPWRGYYTERWVPQVWRCPICYWGRVKNITVNNTSIVFSFPVFTSHFLLHSPRPLVYIGKHEWLWVLLSWLPEVLLWHVKNCWKILNVLNLISFYSKLFQSLFLFKMEGDCWALSGYFFVSFWIILRFLDMMPFLL